RYAADITRPGMLHAAFVGSPFPHARVESVDVEAARKMPGVRAVLTGADVRPARFGRRLQDWPVLAWDRVRFIGDRVAAVAAAAVFEHEFVVPRVHQAYIEPRASLVWIEGDTVHVVTTNKAPFALRDQMAVTIGVPAAKIVVDTPHVGGDFGGKGLSLDEFALYFLARATGRPVRSVLRYPDELQLSNTRHAARIRLRTAVDPNGRITAHQGRVVFDGGAYAAGKPVAGLLPGGP